MRQGTTSATGPIHFPFVDALRGLAILGVIFFHCASVLPQLNSRIMFFASKGMYGVQLFFVVSAFTLFWSLQSRMGVDRRPLCAFYTRRIFRIAPLFWIAVIFYRWYAGFGKGFYAPDGIGIPDVLATLFFVHGWYPSTTNSVVPGGWSISAEFMFYLMLPVLFQLLRSGSRAISCVLITTGLWALALPLFMHILARHFPPDWRPLLETFLYFSFPAQLPVFCCGAVLYWAVVTRINRHDQPAVQPLFAVLIACVWMSGMVAEHIQYAAAFVILAYGLFARPFMLLVNPVTRFIGTISFSAYIWHFWLLEKIYPYFVSHIHLHRLPPRLNGTVQFACVLFVTLAATFAMATLSYYAIENPGQQLGKRVIKAMGWGSPIPSSVPTV